MTTIIDLTNELISLKVKTDKNLEFAIKLEEDDLIETLSYYSKELNTLIKMAKKIHYGRKE